MDENKSIGLRIDLLIYIFFHIERLLIITFFCKKLLHNPQLKMCQTILNKIVKTEMIVLGKLKNRRILSTEIITKKNPA